MIDMLNIEHDQYIVFRNLHTKFGTSISLSCRDRRVHTDILWYKLQEYWQKSLCIMNFSISLGISQPVSLSLSPFLPHPLSLALFLSLSSSLSLSISLYHEKTFFHNALGTIY